MSFLEQLHAEGYAIVEGVLSDEAVQDYIDLLCSTPVESSLRGGRRNLLSVPEMKELADSVALRELVHPILGGDAFPVRGTLFDKQEGSNRKVPWHQDVTIAVKERIDSDGYGPWSVKEGVQHVQPPTAILERMVTVRLHLDDCLASNGALRVIAGSHRLGRLDQNRIHEHVFSSLERTCEVRRGGVLLMSPLTIHASSVSEKPQHRRVIHFDYAKANLIDGLEWFERTADDTSVLI
jgi:ectoine hydroxylase-related dioxygenase (phytanoyl-CoA dioxygenase family)